MILFESVYPVGQVALYAMMMITSTRMMVIGGGGL